MHNAYFGCGVSAVRQAESTEAQMPATSYWWRQVPAPTVNRLIWVAEIIQWKGHSSLIQTILSSESASVSHYLKHILCFLILKRYLTFLCLFPHFKTWDDTYSVRWLDVRGHEIYHIQHAAQPIAGFLETLDFFLPLKARFRMNIEKASMEPWDIYAELK